MDQIDLEGMKWQHIRLDIQDGLDSKETVPLSGFPLIQIYLVARAYFGKINIVLFYKKLHLISTPLIESRL